MNSFSIKGNYVDIENENIFSAEVFIGDGKITSIKKIDQEVEGYILPGFIDSHVHVESSMLVPSEFARLAVVHGTVATISDPHEIANVCGVEGVEYMLENAATVPFKFYFGAPSCVPATDFETAGATVDAEQVKYLLEDSRIKYLSEMMNFPGVLHNDPEVMKKITYSKQMNKPVDGHAPGLKGEAMRQYVAAGISTDHECFTKEEAQEKLEAGMKILIREGSAAKNFEALIELIEEHSDNIMFCSDDKHPDSLALNHINALCARSVQKGFNVFKVLKAACINPINHYKLEVGQLKENDAADFIIVHDLKDFQVKATYINGQKVAENGKTLIEAKKASVINHFNCEPIKVSDLELFLENYAVSGKVPVMEALDGQLITNKLWFSADEISTKNGSIISDTEKDILKMVVINRYNQSTVAKCLIKNFGLKNGAIASTVAHDSHNIIAVGVNDEDLCIAINQLIDVKGGVSCVNGNTQHVLPLPVAGLMSNEDGYAVANAYTKIDLAAKNLGSTLAAPYMTLSFMALLVIPHLKLSDKGLFDGDSFSFVVNS